MSSQYEIRMCEVKQQIEYKNEFYFYIKKLSFLIT